MERGEGERGRDNGKGRVGDRGGGEREEEERKGRDREKGRVGEGEVNGETEEKGE